MASIGHIAVGMLAARLHGEPASVRGSLWPALLLWPAISLLPDADVLAFRLGIAYGHAWGHRGIAHSLAFLLALGLCLGALAPLFGQRALRTGVVATFVLISHPLLDVLTDGGLGCALFWPLDKGRYFAPWRPIPVAPIGMAFFSRAGAAVALTELGMFAPLLLYALWPRPKLRSTTGRD